jgi:hypothetical protein
MYMQFFLGLREYTYEDVFDRSLFTTLRYRLGADKFDAMTRHTHQLIEIEMVAVIKLNADRHLFIQREV